MLDTTLVGGASTVRYQITAQRGSVAGQPSGPITVSGAEFKGNPKLAA